MVSEDVKLFAYFTYVSLPLFQSYALVTSVLSFTSVQTACAHGLADAVHLFGMTHAVFGTDTFKLMP